MLSPSLMLAESKSPNPQKAKRAKLMLEIYAVLLAAELDYRAGDNESEEQHRIKRCQLMSDIGQAMANPAVNDKKPARLIRTESSPRPLGIYIPQPQSTGKAIRKPTPKPTATHKSRVTASAAR